MINFHQWDHSSWIYLYTYEFYEIYEKYSSNYMQLQDGRNLCNHLVMFSSLLLVIALNQWWIELAFTRINLEWQGTFLSLFIYFFFFCKMFLIPCNRKKCQCLFRTKVTYTIYRITYNYQYAPRSLRLIFCSRLWVSALNFLKNFKTM